MMTRRNVLGAAAIVIVALLLAALVFYPIESSRTEIAKTPGPTETPVPKSTPKPKVIDPDEEPIVVDDLVSPEPTTIPAAPPTKSLPVRTHARSAEFESHGRLPLCAEPVIAPCSSVRNAGFARTRAYSTEKIIKNSEEECGVCHFKTVEAWKATVHSTTFAEIYKTPQAQEIAAKMGARSIAQDPLCTQCHYTLMAEKEGGRAKAIQGIGCQSCHGPAADWLEPHADTESEPDRLLRLAPLEALGMRPTYRFYEFVRACYDCHWIPFPDLVNRGGHKFASDFEFVAWSQGEVRHNFLPLPHEAKNNSRDRRWLRYSFVVGKMIALEYTLRAMGTVKGPGNYRDQVVDTFRRAVRDMDMLVLGAEKEFRPALSAALRACAGTTTYCDAAEFVAREAQKIENSILELSFVDALLPDPAKYRGTPFGE